jgi:hypothetical protein
MCGSRRSSRSDFGMGTVRGYLLCEMKKGGMVGGDRVAPFLGRNLAAWNKPTDRLD